MIYLDNAATSRPKPPGVAEAVLAAIGHGVLKEGQVINKLIEEYDKKHKKELTDTEVLAAIS